METTVGNEWARLGMQVGRRSGKDLLVRVSLR